MPLDIQNTTWEGAFGEFFWGSKHTVSGGGYWLDVEGSGKSLWKKTHFFFGENVVLGTFSERIEAKLIADTNEKQSLAGALMDWVASHEQSWV